MTQALIELHLKASKHYGTLRIAIYLCLTAIGVMILKFLRPLLSCNLYRNMSFQYFKHFNTSYLTKHKDKSLNGEKKMEIKLSLLLITCMFGNGYSMSKRRNTVMAVYADRLEFRLHPAELQVKPHL